MTVGAEDNLTLENVETATQRTYCDYANKASRRIYASTSCTLSCAVLMIVSLFLAALFSALFYEFQLQKAGIEQELARCKQLHTKARCSDASASADFGEKYREKDCRQSEICLASMSNIYVVAIAKTLSAFRSPINITTPNGVSELCCALTCCFTFFVAYMLLVRIGFIDRKKPNKQMGPKQARHRQAAN